MYGREHKLVGKRIDAIYLNEDNDHIVFVTDQGNLGYYADGDCCSYTYINDIVGVQALLGNVVTSADDGFIDYDGDDDGSTYGDVIKKYSLKLTTKDGYTDIIYRNYSNGYYGGSLDRSSNNQFDNSYTQVTQDISK